MIAITCCNGCVPPKRNGYCHTYCEIYLTAKEEHDKQKAIADQKRDVQGGLVGQMCQGINKAAKIRRKMKGRSYGW